MKRSWDNRATITLALGLETTRKTASLTMLDLAAKADCTPQHIANIEQSKTNPSQASIAKLAAALHRTPADLYMAGEREVEKQILVAATARRDQAQRERDLETVLAVLEHLDRKDLAAVAAAATKLSN